MGFFTIIDVTKPFFFRSGHSLFQLKRRRDTQMKSGPGIFLRFPTKKLFNQKEGIFIRENLAFPMMLFKIAFD